MSEPTRPRISLLMPVYNTPVDVLEETIESVFGQSSPEWELCICDDASTDVDVIETLSDYIGVDPRVKIIRSDLNLHIARATNAAAEFATGDFVAFIDHDDLLAPQAVERMIAAIDTDTDVDFLYSDEDKREPDGSPSEPYFKPDWSPEHLQSVMYVLHMMVIRKSLFLQVGGLRHEYTGAQDYDLALRATAAARKVVHVPEVLYHWRKIPGSAAAVVDAKPQALINAKAAVLDFVRSQDPNAQVLDGAFKGSFRVAWPIDGDRVVTLLMLTNCSSKMVEGRGEILLAENAIRSIVERSTHRNYELVLVDNGNASAEFRSQLKAWGVRLSSYSFEEPFNFAKKMNFALSLVKTRDVILLNDDIEVISPDWMEALLGLSGRPEIGAVGARLLYANDHVQHQGMALGVMGPSAHLFHNLHKDNVAYCGYSHLIRNYSAVTGAVLATKMDIVREVGFFDEKFGIDYNDIDFCLRVRRAGYRIVYTPFAELYHFEGSSLARSVVTASDEAAFKERWSDLIERDPYYNPSLPRDRGDFVVSAW